MGPMLLLVLGILSAVGFSLYQFGEHHRFDIVPDAKGGIFILDKKSSAINYCNDKTCSLVGNGALPSHIMNNPSAIASMQGAIMGAPAAVSAPQAGQAPNGMNANIAASGVANAAHVSAPQAGQAPNGMNANIAASGVANAAQADVVTAVHDDGDVQNADAADAEAAHPDVEAPHPDEAEQPADAAAEAAAPEGYAFN